MRFTSRTMHKILALLTVGSGLTTHSFASDDGAAPTSGGSNHHAQAAQAVTANQIERDRLLAQQLRDQRAQEVPVARRNDDGGQGFRGLNDETAEAKERRRKAEEAAPPKSGAERPNPKLVKNAKILGLKAKSLDQLTWAEVNKAYKKLAIEYHPDKNFSNAAEAEAKFREVTAARDYFEELHEKKQLKD